MTMPNPNGRSRLPDGVPADLVAPPPPDVPADEPTPAEKALRAEIRRDRWELAWALTVVASTLTVAVAAIFGVAALRTIADEQRRANALAHAQHATPPVVIPGEEEHDGGK